MAQLVCERAFGLLASMCRRRSGLNPGFTRGRQLAPIQLKITSLCQGTIKTNQQIWMSPFAPMPVPGDMRTCLFHTKNIWISCLLHTKNIHDDVIKRKHFPRYWPFVRGIQLSPVNSSHKGQWRAALVFTLICARINGWVNNREAGDLRRYRTHYDVIVMLKANAKWWQPRGKTPHPGWTAVVGCALFCSAGAHPFLRMGHGRMVSTQATAMGDKEVSMRSRGLGF